GMTAIRLDARWSHIAPAGSARPAGFDASNPADGAYRWQVLDEQVKRAVAHGLDPIVGFDSAPSWAEGRGSGPGGTVRPDPRELGRFAHAAAERYSGHFAGLPRVRYWQAWNEPNLILFLNPQ